MTDTRSAVTSAKPVRGWRKRSTQRQSRHSCARSLVARSGSFSSASLASSASSANCASQLLLVTACRGLHAKPVHKPWIFAPESHQKKCHTLQSNFTRKSLKTHDGHPKEVTHNSEVQCTGISAVWRRRRREFSNFNFPPSLFRLPETNRRFLRASRYCAPHPSPHAPRGIRALRCYKDGEEIPL